MRAATVKTRNVSMLFAAIERIHARGAAIPGIGLIYGPTGSGKTTALMAAAGLFRATFIRAMAMGSASSLMDDLCFELAVDPPRPKAQRFRAIVAALRQNPRPVFIDEADYLCRQSEMLDLVRDLHDMAGIPVFLIGMEGIEKRLAGRHPQFARRVSEPIHFGPCTLKDAALLAAELCEGVAVAPDMVTAIHAKAEGATGLIVMALTHVEDHCRGMRIDRIDAAQWGDRPLFLDAGRGGGRRGKVTAGGA